MADSHGDREGLRPHVVVGVAVLDAGDLRGRVGHREVAPGADRLRDDAVDGGQDPGFVGELGVEAREERETRGEEGRLLGCHVFLEQA